MMKQQTYDDFIERNRAIRERLDVLLTIKETRDILKCSTRHIFTLAEQGHLDLYDIAGERVVGVEARSNGVRVSPESLDVFLDQNRI